MAGDGGNGKDNFGLGPERDCAGCEWAVMTHQNHVRLLQLERREGEWLAETRATRDALREHRVAIGGEFATVTRRLTDSFDALTRTLVDTVGELRADVKALIVKYEQLSRLVAKHIVED